MSRASAVHSGLSELVVDSGYWGAVVERLVDQTAALLAARTVRLVVRDPDRPSAGVLSAVAGVHEYELGRTYEDLDRPAGELASGTWLPVPTRGGGRALLGLEADLQAPGARELAALQADT